MLLASMLSAMKTRSRQTMHHGIHDKTQFGAISMIILLGDDYQIPSVDTGAFYALHKNNCTKSITTQSGYNLFKHLETIPWY
jgi:hypothetical protein